MPEISYPEARDKNWVSLMLVPGDHVVMWKNQKESMSVPDVDVVFLVLVILPEKKKIRHHFL